MKPYPNYRRKGVKVNNVAPVQHRKLHYRLVITCMGSAFRWRVMAEDTQRASGTSSTRKAAMVAGGAALKELKGQTA